MESDPNSNQQQNHRFLLSGNTESTAAAKADHGEQDAELDLDSDVAFDVIEGEEVKVEKKKKRKVRFNDCSLTQVLEFEPSELEEIFYGGNWIPQRYATVPLVADGMLHAKVHLTGPEFKISTNGGPCLTPCEAGCSAADNMIMELDMKAEEEEQQDT